LKMTIYSGLFGATKVYQIVNDPNLIGIPDGMIRAPENRGVYFFSIFPALMYYLPFALAF
jgi:hypothetical protein